MENAHSREKLPNGVLPNIRSYCVDGILVGIDLTSGEFHIESEDIEKAIPIYDDLFVYRGLDQADLKNFFLAAEYIKLTEKQLPVFRGVDESGTPPQRAAISIVK